MKSGKGSAKGRVEVKARDWITLEHHLGVFIDHKRHRVEITWACDCGKKKCKVPHTDFAVYVCPVKPCPGG